MVCPRLAATALAAAIVAVTVQALPLQMTVQPRQIECLYEQAEEEYVSLSLSFLNTREWVAS
jgi:hypothetical protein